MKNIKFTDYKRTQVLGRLRICLEFAKKQKLSGKTILDVGCANGVMAYLLLSQKPKRYIGVDPNKAAIKLAKSHIKDAQFYVAPADKIPCKSGSADVAFMFDVIEHVPVGGEFAALSEINRILKKSGRLVLSTPNNNLLMNFLDPAWLIEGHRHYHPQQIKDLLQKSGFENIEIEVRGGIWFLIYLNLLYVSKWIFGNTEFRSDFIQRKDDMQFSKPGTHTIFVVAKKR